MKILPRLRAGSWNFILCRLKLGTHKMEQTDGWRSDPHRRRASTGIRPSSSGRRKLPSACRSGMQRACACSRPHRAPSPSIVPSVLSVADGTPQELRSGAWVVLAEQTRLGRMRGDCPTSSQQHTSAHLRPPLAGALHVERGRGVRHQRPRSAAPPHTAPKGGRRLRAATRTRQPHAAGSTRVSVCLRARARAPRRAAVTARAP